MQQKVKFFTLGCRSNQSETAVLRNLFQQKGYAVASEKSTADLAVINTCTVTEKGDQDARKLVQRLRRDNPRIKIALIGCQAQTQKEELIKLPNVHWIVGNAEKMNLVSLMETVTPMIHKPQVIVKSIPKKKFTVPAAGIEISRTRANLKIQDGCESFCAYCEVPFARGGARSRDFDDIIKEAKILIDAGHKEIVLTGINIGAYRDEHKTLLDVIKRLDTLPGLERIRVSSIEPNTINDDLILWMGTKTKLCRYMHVPIQSASDAILQSMGRKYACKDLELLFDFISQNIDGVCIGADVITGFPGETEDDFIQTYEFLADSPIAYFHIFSYSNRKHARSRLFPGQVERSVIQQRSDLLHKLAIRKKEVFLDSFIGTVQKVLFEELKRGAWIGLTDNYLRVRVPSQSDLRNQILSVEIIGRTEDVLNGKIV